LDQAAVPWSGFWMGEQWRAQFDAEVSFANGGGPLARILTRRRCRGRVSGWVSSGGHSSTRR
ncbi:hypothetical protein, partial [Micromonospora tarensis]|uniref:hypothetical protein n=1 Tax=Micromonospora tarensis TaxID=2806100 RepID=UPI001EE45C66